jgi:hypothetical protein
MYLSIYMHIILNHTYSIFTNSKSITLEKLRSTMEQMLALVCSTVFPVSDSTAADGDADDKFEFYEPMVFDLVTKQLRVEQYFRLITKVQKQSSSNPSEVSSQKGWKVLNFYLIYWTYVCMYVWKRYGRYTRVFNRDFLSIHFCDFGRRFEISDLQLAPPKWTTSSSRRSQCGCGKVSINWSQSHDF